MNKTLILIAILALTTLNFNKLDGQARIKSGLAPIIMWRIPITTVLGNSADLMRFSKKIKYNKFDFDTGSAIPISFLYRDSVFYIPNVVKGIILGYNKSGRLITKNIFPDSTTLGFIAINSKGNYVSNNYFDRTLTEWNPMSEKILQRSRTSSPFIFTSSKGECYYLNGNSLINEEASDKLNLPQNNQWFSEAYTSLSINSSNIFITHFEDFEWKLEIIGLRNDSLKTIQLDSSLNMYTAMKIISSTSNEVVGLFVNESNGEALIETIGATSGKVINSREITYPEFPEPGFAGEIFSWPDGVVYSYNPVESRLYAMSLNSKYMSMYYYQLK